MFMADIIKLVDYRLPPAPPRVYIQLVTKRGGILDTIVIENIGRFEFARVMVNSTQIYVQIARRLERAGLPTRQIEIKRAPASDADTGTIVVADLSDAESLIWSLLHAEGLEEDDYA
jgi:hypothetical protein